jgi:hypothetical protein
LTLKSIIEPFLEPFQIIDRVRRLTEDSRLTEKQKIAAKQFIKEYEMRQQGKTQISHWLEKLNIKVSSYTSLSVTQLLTPPLLRLHLRYARRLF